MLQIIEVITVLIALTQCVFAQDVQASVPTVSDNTINPIQIEDPRDQTNYISPNSPTTIPSSASTSATSAVGQIVLCMTLDSEGEICSTYAAMTTFSSLTSIGTEGILTASDTRSTQLVTRTATSAKMTSTGTDTRTSGTEATASATESREGSGAERLAEIGWKQVAVGSVLAVVGGFLAM